jgi:hypothetical protein
VDRCAAVARDDPTFVDVERPLALALLQHAPRAPELGAEHRDERLPVHDLGQEGPQLGISDLLEIRHVAADRRLELRALEQPARCRALALDRLHAALANAPHPQAPAGPRERVVLGVEVGRIERLRQRTRLRKAAHQRIAAQAPEILRAGVELELDLAIRLHRGKDTPMLPSPSAGARVAFV